MIMIINEAKTVRNKYALSTETMQDLLSIYKDNKSIYKDNKNLQNNVVIKNGQQRIMHI